MTSSPPKSVTFDNTINGGDNNDFSSKKQIYSAANEEDFSSSSVPTWARRGISWRSVREVFDEDFIPDDEKTEDLLELEMKHLDDTMSKYAMLYNIVGLNYLDQVCADVEPENRLFVHRQIHEQLTREMASRKQLLHNHDQATEQDKNNNNNNKNSGEGSSARTASVAFCFNCRESGHTHGVCSKPRRCYICHDPRHDAFVCIANPVLGSEFYDPDEKCAICGDRGHMSVRCKSRGGPWQGKPGYAHLPDTTYPRPVVIHTGGRKAGDNSDAANNSSPYNKQLSILSSQSQQQQQHAPGGVNDSKSAREVIIRLAQVYRKKDLGLMKLMREAELFCGSLSMLADENLTVAQRSSLRQALDFLRPSVAGVDLTTFGVVLNPKNQGVIGSKKPKTSAGSNNVLDDEAALNELRTSSIDFNVVFGSHIERYSRSESSAEFRVGLQRIQARTGLKPSDINLYDDDEVAARINKQVMLAAEAARKAQARTLQLQREIERSQGGAGGGSSVSGLSSSRATSASSSHGTSSPTNNANNNTNKSSRRRTGKPKPSATATDEASHHLHQNQQNTPTEVKTPLGKMKGSKPAAAAATPTTATTAIANEKPSTNIFKGTGLRHISTLDPVAAERRARGRREAAGEATLMRWTRLLSRGRDVTQVTSQEATSSSNTMSLSKQTLRARAEEDLLRLMRAAVNKKGDASVIEGKKLKIPRVQHGTIGRDSIIRAWAEHKITPIDEVSPAASARTNNPSPPTRQHSANNNNKGMTTRSSSYQNEDDYDEDEDGENKAMKKSSGFHHHHRKSFRNDGDPSAGMNQRTNSGFFESGNNTEKPHVNSKFSSSWGDLWSVPKNNNNNDENNNNNVEMSPVRRLGSSIRKSNSSSPLKFGHDENNNGLEAILNLSPKPSFRNSPTNSPTSKQKREQHSGSKSPKTPKKDNNVVKLRRRQITVQIKDSPSTVLKSPPLSPTAINNAQSIRSASSPFENRSPKSKRRPSSSQLLMNRRPSSSGLGLSLQCEQSGSGVFSLESSSMNNNNNKEQEQEKIAKSEHSRQIATPRSNYRNDHDKLDCDIRLPKREEGKNGEEAEEPIRNWNAHRVAMTWGKQQENGGVRKNNRGDKVDVWLMAKDRYNKSVDEAKSLRDQKIEWGTRREESVAAKNDFDAFMLKLGNPPPIAKVIDPDVVNKWRGRFQTARIKAGVKDAAIKESRLVHRSVVATARLGGAAVCDGATKRAERWLRSHRDVETAVEGSGSSSALLSEHSSMWTILCHRIAIAAVRVRAKKELAEQLREFLARLPHGRATQDESIRMVYLFEEMVYGDEISEQVKQRREEETKKAEKNACFADLMMMKAFPHFCDVDNPKRFSGDGEGSINNNNNNKHSSSMSSSSSAMKPKTTLDRCMEEWLLGNKRDDENKKKRLQASGGGGDDADGDASKNATPHYAQAKDIDAQVRKANKDDLESQRKKDFYSIQQQRDMIQRQHQILEETHKRGSSSNNNTPSPLLLNIPHTTSRPGSMATLANAKNGRNFGSLTAMSSRPHSAATMSSATPQGSTALASPTGIQHHQGSPTFGSLIFSMSSSDDILLLQQQHQQQNNGKPAAAFGSQRPSDLERLLSAPVTAQDLEKLIEKACRESYASLHDSDEWKRTLPSNTKIWAKDDPRRLMPRTQEGESVASFLRWIVSPAATEGALGRVISKFTTQAGLFDFDLAFKEINPAARVAPAVAAPAQNEDEEGYLSIKNNENGAKGTGSAIQNAAAVLIVGNSGRALDEEGTNNTMMPHPPSAKSSNFQRRDSSKVLLTRDQNSGELLLGSKQNTRKNVGQITILSVESSPNASGALNIPR